MWLQRVQNPFLKNIMSHVAYQIKDNEKENTVVQKFCPGDMTGGHLSQKSRILGPVGFFLFLIVTQHLLGFLS